MRPFKKLCIKPFKIKTINPWCANIINILLWEITVTFQKYSNKGGITSLLQVSLYLIYEMISRFWYVLLQCQILCTPPLRGREVEDWHIRTTMCKKELLETCFKAQESQLCALGDERHDLTRESAGNAAPSPLSLVNPPLSKGHWQIPVYLSVGQEDGLVLH